MGVKKLHENQICMISAHNITGLVLAGGRGTRMGGVDKGLQNFEGRPLAQNALMRLQPQVGAVYINANQHLDVYQSMGVPVLPDTLPDFPGPLAGFLVGLEHCPTEWLLTVPCDAPWFPLDLAERLAVAATQEGVLMAQAAAPEGGREGSPPRLQHLQRLQPVFCLLHTQLLPSLRQFMGNGGHKVGAWTTQQSRTVVAFDAPDDNPRAFFNTNTLADLHPD